MCVSEICVKRIHVNQGLSVPLSKVILYVGHIHLATRKLFRRRLGISVAFESKEKRYAKFRVRRCQHAKVLKIYEKEFKN